MTRSSAKATVTTIGLVLIALAVLAAVFVPPIVFALLVVVAFVLPADLALEQRAPAPAIAQAAPRRITHPRGPPRS